MLHRFGDHTLWFCRLTAFILHAASWDYLMSNNYNILCVGHDSAALQVRSAVLASAGHQVKVVTFYWALMLLRMGDFDAVILCHTLAQWERQLLGFQIESLGRKTPVFQLCSSVQGAVVQHVGACVNSAKMQSAVISVLEHNSDSAAA
jgi:CheY-like chemotaxis protein